MKGITRTQLQRWVIIFLALVLVFLIVSSIIQRRKEAKEAQNETIDVAFLDARNGDTKDTDGDGVPDWEEALWDLDPEKPDTDGDGVLDARYIETKKNISEHRDVSVGVRVLPLNDLTESEKLGRSLFSALFAIEASGDSLGTQTQDQISENISDYIQNINVSKEVYLRENLHIVENSKENSEKYRREFEALFASDPIKEEDIEFILKRLVSKDGYETEIAQLTNRYDLLLTQLSQLQVPAVIASRHAQLLNEIAYLTGGLKNINQDEPDDFVSLAFFSQMQTKLTQISTTLSYIEEYFTIIDQEGIFDDTQLDYQP